MPSSLSLPFLIIHNVVLLLPPPPSSTGCVERVGESVKKKGYLKCIIYTVLMRSFWSGSRFCYCQVSSGAEGAEEGKDRRSRESDWMMERARGSLDIVPQRHCCCCISLSVLLAWSHFPLQHYRVVSTSIWKVDTCLTRDRGKTLPISYDEELCREEEAREEEKVVEALELGIPFFPKVVLCVTAWLSPEFNQLHSAMWGS